MQSGGKMKTDLLIILAIGIIGFTTIPYSYASCAAPLFGPPGPCFDSFMVSTDTPLTEHSIMENYARNIEMNYGDWQMSDRNWTDDNIELELPAIICTEFVADGMKQYRMAKWVDSQTISSFENHRDDSLCDKWLAPIDDGIKVAWDKPNYLPNDVGTVRVSDMKLNMNDQKIDSFDIHVWSDVDHDGIKLTITETGNASGIFESKVFFTTMDKSSDIHLLVEDVVYADHKSNVGSARIIDNPKIGNDMQSDEIKIPFGETVSLDDLKITFYDIEDSRCPSDVTCVWEGNVVTMIRISNFTHSIDGPQEIGFVQKSFPPYLITIKDIQPYPVSSEKPDYVATLGVAKIPEFTDEQICRVGNILVNGICIPPSKLDISDFTEFHVGQVMWHEANFHNLLNSFAKKIQVTDQDMNQDNAKIETILVSIWSDSDSDGITVSAYETGKDTGIFESVIYFAEKPSIGQRIYVQIGDSVTAEYTDETISDADKMQISDTLIIKGFSRENDANFRVDDPDFVRQNFQTGETIPNLFVVQIIEGLGAGLIVLFIVVYAIKKRGQK